MSNEDPNYSNSLIGRLDRLETKVDNLNEALVLLARVEERSNIQHHWNERQSGVHADLYHRIEALEKFQWRIAGALLIVAIVAGYVMPQVAKVLIGGD